MPSVRYVAKDVDRDVISAPETVLSASGCTGAQLTSCCLAGRGGEPPPADAQALPGSCNMPAVELYLPVTISAEGVPLDAPRPGDGFALSGSRTAPLQRAFGDAPGSTHQESQVSMESSFTLIKSSRDALRAMGVAAKGSARFLCLPGEVTGNLSEVDSSSDRSFKMLYRRSIVLRSESVDEASEANPAALGMEASELLEKVGGYYVSKVFYGALLEIDFVFEAQSVYEKDEWTVIACAELDMGFFKVGKTWKFGESSESLESLLDLRASVRCVGNKEVSGMECNTVEDAENIIKKFQNTVGEGDAAVVGFQVRALPVAVFPQLGTLARMQVERAEANLEEANAFLATYSDALRRCKTAIRKFSRPGAAGGPPERSRKLLLAAAQRIKEELGLAGFVREYLDVDFLRIARESIMEFGGKNSDSYLASLDGLSLEAAGLAGLASLDLGLGSYAGYAVAGVPEWKGMVAGRLSMEVVAYEGGFQDGRFHGEGRMSYKNGNLYNGAWAVGKPEGYGTMEYPHGTADEKDIRSFAGLWSKGKRNGHGLASYADGHTYSGTWEDDLRQE